MNAFYRKSSVAAIALASALAASSGSALADVSPQDVYDSWGDYFASFGYSLDAEPLYRGGNITLPTLNLVFEIPAGTTPGSASGGTVTMTVADIQLNDNGDGTVEVLFPANTPVVVSGEGIEGENFTFKADFLSENYKTIVSGTPDVMTYTMAADSIGLAAVSFEGDDGLKQVPGKIGFSMTGAKGTSVMDSSKGGFAITQDFTAETLKYDVDINMVEGDNPGYLIWNGLINDVASTSDMTLPEEFDMNDMAAAMKAGYAVRGSLTYQSGQGGIDFEDTEEKFKVTTSSTGGAFLMDMSRDGIAYDVSSTGMVLHVEGKDVPFPIDTTIGQTRFGISIPVEAREDEQKFSATIGLTDLAIPEMVWMMADPTGGLPHDPVTEEIALSGNGVLNVDIMDQDAMMALGMSQKVPGQLNGVKLDSLVVKAAGATILADADIAVDNNGKSVFNPMMPAFGGTANLRLTGVTGLIEKLSQMGLMPPGPAMMGAGMIKQMGKPESGPDDFSAVIELTPAGDLSVNGTPFPLR